MALPWYDPRELAFSLGATLPLFIFYAWRIYSCVLKHHEGLKFFMRYEDLRAEIEKLYQSLSMDDIDLPSLRMDFLASAAWNLYEERVGSLRRALRADVYTVILIGFLGTLIGVVSAFWKLSVGAGAAVTSPTQVISGLLKGGLSTALISSLVASVLGGLAMTYLSLTEVQAVKARNELLRALREVLA